VVGGGGATNSKYINVSLPKFGGISLIRMYQGLVVCRGVSRSCIAVVEV
jgi:hypothetical protein